MDCKGFLQSQKKEKPGIVTVLHDTFEFLLEEIKSPLDIFKVLATREDDLS